MENHNAPSDIDEDDDIIIEDDDEDEARSMTPEERERENIRLQQEYIEWLRAGSPRSKEEEEYNAQCG